MEEYLERIDHYVQEIRAVVDKIGAAAVGDAARTLEGIDIAYEDYLARKKKPDDILIIASAARSYGLVAKSVSRNASKLPIGSKNPESAIKLARLANELIDHTETCIAKITNQYERKLSNEDSDMAAQKAKELYARLINNLQDYEQRLFGRIEAVDRKIQKHSSVVESLDKSIKEKLEEFTRTAQSAISDIYSKNEQIDKVLGHAAGRVIAGDFEKSAASEKSAADWLRLGSLLCMFLIVCMLGYSFYETTKIDFEVQKSLFRVVLAFLLSAPTAYLARESSKHRAQQYLHLQTSLDLKAITPYIASLPEETQHQIKKEIASKIFGDRGTSPSSSDSFPINVQELLMEAIKRPWSENKSVTQSDKHKP